MDFRLKRRDGTTTLDARVTIENGAVTLHGRTGNPTRNRDYSPALDLILDLLNAQAETIDRVLLDSGPARKRPVAERLLAERGDFERLPAKEVRNQIRTRMRNFGRAPGMLAHKGDSSKKLLIETSLSDGELRRRLRVTPVAAGSSSPALGVGEPEPGRTPAMSRPQPPMIFFNIGWMKYYAGADPQDPTLGGMGYLKEHEHGAEAFNFLPDAQGRLRGYRAGHVNRLGIERLGAAPGVNELSGVLVIWMAREPKSKRTMIVGWYENARVYARAQPQSRRVNGETWPFSVEARRADGYLVPAQNRTFEIQSARTAEGGFGMSPTWYGTEAINARVWKYVQSVRRGAERQSRRTPRDQPPINIDPELRRKVEKAAVEHATAFFESAEGGAHDVRSVEPYGRGWDLEASNEDGQLLIEVKGLQGLHLVCELTSNEYEKMMMPAYRDRYVIYIVNNALEETPIASVFRRESNGNWQAEDGRTLDIEERRSAVLRYGCPTT